MKKNLLLFFVVSVVAVLVINLSAKRGRKITQKDLVIINDTSDKVSTEYTKNDQKMIEVIDPGKNITGGQGFIRIHVPTREGTYEISYPFPRPENKPSLIKLSEVMVSTKEIGMTKHDYRTEKGMIDDIQVFYEEIPLFADPIM